MGVEDTVDIDHTEDLISFFLQEMEFHGRSERTRTAYRRVLDEFDAFIRTNYDSTTRVASRRECMAWVHSLRGNHAPSTVASYASYVHRFYAYLTQVGVLDSNPMALVLSEMDESIDVDPSRREISIPQMRDFVADILHPLERAVIVTLLKTGIRVGECCNIDLRDVHIDDPEIADSYDWVHRGALDGRPNSIFISSEPARGSSYNGEVRSASNKRKRDTVIPIDAELQSSLKRWLAIRPDAPSPADPLFCSTNQWGTRTTPSMIRDIVETHASPRGWYRRGGSSEENVTPHYFRHFFTTHLRDRTGDRGIVKYLRGDVASDIIDTYTHDWGNRVRSVYDANIYRLVV